MLSPLLFNIYIDDLIEKLNEIATATCYAYADDIIIITENMDQLLKCIKLIDEWC